MNYETEPHNMTWMQHEDLSRQLTSSWTHKHKMFDLVPELYVNNTGPRFTLTTLRIPFIYMLYTPTDTFSQQQLRLREEKKNKNKKTTAHVLA